MEQFANYIDGQWVTSDQSTRNVNPSNVDDVSGEFARANACRCQCDIGSSCSEKATKAPEQTGVKAASIKPR